MSQANVELNRRGFQAFNERDLDGLLEALHEDVELVPVLAAMEGGYRGHDGARRWWTTLLSGFPDINVEVLEVRDLGEVTVASVRVTGHGAETDTPFDASVWQVHQWRDGKCTSWHAYTSEGDALEAAALCE
jgi:ketosteroid isomerase-like protein